jgi:hypothetical protein
MEQLNRVDGAAGQVPLQAAPDDFDLRKLGHRPVPS